jgi:probable rRNA maturation factor
MKAKMLQIELNAGSNWQREFDWQSLCEKAVKAAVNKTPFAELDQQGFTVEVSIKLSDNDEVQHLNASYRGKDKPTNVLSFPQIQQDLLATLANTDDGEALLGDIILAQELCDDEARDKSIAFASHVSHLIVHGTLHLLGYDHQDEAEAMVMEELEAHTLATLGIDNPYAEDTLNR